MFSRFLIVMFALCTLPALAQNNSSGDDWADALPKWDTSCVTKGCLIQADVLRGRSDDAAAPDAKDPHEYVSIYIAFDRKTQKPAYFAFHVDPAAQPDQGVFIAFTHTRKDGESWKVDIDQDKIPRLVFDSCNKDSCSARVGQGIIQEGANRRVDLLDKFLNSNHIMLLYMKNGKPYRTMVILASFKKEYQRMLSSGLLKPQADAPK